MGLILKIVDLMIQTVQNLILLMIVEKMIELIHLMEQILNFVELMILEILKMILIELMIDKLKIVMFQNLVE